MDEFEIFVSINATADALPFPHPIPFTLPIHCSFACTFFTHFTSIEYMHIHTLVYVIDGRNYFFEHLDPELSCKIILYNMFLVGSILSTYIYLLGYL